MIDAVSCGSTGRRGSHIQIQPWVEWLGWGRGKSGHGGTLHEPRSTEAIWLEKFSPWAASHGEVHSHPDDDNAHVDVNDCGQANGHGDGHVQQLMGDCQSFQCLLCPLLPFSSA